MTVHLILADQQLLFRQSLAKALTEAGWSQITQVSHHSALEQAFLESATNILVIDRWLPEIDITLYCRSRMNTHPNLRILVLTGYESEARELQLNTLLAGAAGCLSKEHAAHTYLAAIQVLIQGQVIYQYATITSALRPYESFDSSPSISATSTPLPTLNHGLDDLTAREIEILQLVAKGKGNPEIALTLNITENTVMKHVSHIISKLNVRNRMEAGLVYLRSI
jgi:DNA-binding NarL/FixJ family response regulator